jgi:RNA polymerase sigma-70 factor (ECF subfamily)
VFPVAATERLRPLRKNGILEVEPLIKRCREGDELAWEALVRQFQGRVFGVVYHYLRDREEARDVAQESFVRIYRNLDKFEVGGNFAAWALRIARNCAIDRLRHLKARPPRDDVQADEYLELTDTGATPESGAMGNERQQLVYRALELMSAMNREIILLKDIQGLKQQEIAELLSVPLGTVKTRSSRARVELARRILELDPSYGA